MLHFNGWNIIKAILSNFHGHELEELSDLSHFVSTKLVVVTVGWWFLLFSFPSFPFLLFSFLFLFLSVFLSSFLSSFSLLSLSLSISLSLCLISVFCFFFVIVYSLIVLLSSFSIVAFFFLLFLSFFLPFCLSLSLSLSRSSFSYFSPLCVLFSLKLKGIFWLQFLISLEAFFGCGRLSFGCIRRSKYFGTQWHARL